MIKLHLTGRFDLEYRELVAIQPEIKKVVIKRVKWFRKNPDDTRLESHPLTQRLEGKFAFAITDDIRIVYEWLGETTVRFLSIGRHYQVYRKG